MKFASFNGAIDSARTDLNDGGGFLWRQHSHDLATIFAPGREFFACAFDHHDAAFYGMNRGSPFNVHLASAIAALNLIIKNGARLFRAILKRTMQVVFTLALPALVRILLERQRRDVADHLEGIRITGYPDNLVQIVVSIDK